MSECPCAATLIILKGLLPWPQESRLFIHLLVNKSLLQMLPWVGPVLSMGRDRPDPGRQLPGHRCAVWPELHWGQPGRLVWPGVRVGAGEGGPGRGLSRGWSNLLGSQ